MSQLRKKDCREGGFIFTLDSIAAACIIALLAVTWSISVRSKEGEAYYRYMEKIARDKSLTGLYTADNTSDYFVPNDVNRNIVCKKYFVYTTNPRIAQSDMNVRVICVSDVLVMIP
ncbi:MAG: hypothetical protein QXM75_01945 [Candidatus Diapherotrites archaeon]